MKEYYTDESSFSIDLDTIVVNEQFKVKAKALGNEEKEREAIFTRVSFNFTDDKFCGILCNCGHKFDSETKPSFSDLSEHLSSLEDASLHKGNEMQTFIGYEGVDLAKKIGTGMRFRFEADKVIKDEGKKRSAIFTSKKTPQADLDSAALSKVTYSCECGCNFDKKSGQSASSLYRHVMKKQSSPHEEKKKIVKPPSIFALQMKIQAKEAAKKLEEKQKNDLESSSSDYSSIATCSYFE